MFATLPQEFQLDRLCSYPTRRLKLQSTSEFWFHYIAGRSPVRWLHKNHCMQVACSAVLELKWNFEHQPIVPCRVNHGKCERTRKLHAAAQNCRELSNFRKIRLNFISPAPAFGTQATQCTVGGPSAQSSLLTGQMRPVAENRSLNQTWLDPTRINQSLRIVDRSGKPLLPNATAEHCRQATIRIISQGEGLRPLASNRERVQPLTSSRIGEVK